MQKAPVNQVKYSISSTVFNKGIMQNLGRNIIICVTSGLMLNFAGCAGRPCGCVGSPLHSTMHYNNVQASIYRNNQCLITMRIGMTQDETRFHMGGIPERSEGYEWGAVWLYRTAMTSGVYGTADSDFTPIVFDQTGKVVGWGRNFYKEHVRHYNVTIKQQNE